MEGGVHYPLGKHGAVSPACCWRVANFCRTSLVAAPSGEELCSSTTHIHTQTSVIYIYTFWYFSKHILSLDYLLPLLQVYTALFDHWTWAQWSISCRNWKIAWEFSSTRGAFQKQHFLYYFYNLPVECFEILFWEMLKMYSLNENWNSWKQWQTIIGHSDKLTLPAHLTETNWFFVFSYLNILAENCNLQTQQSCNNCFKIKDSYKLMNDECSKNVIEDRMRGK